MKKWIPILLMVMAMISVQPAEALCFNPLKLFCIFDSPDQEEVRFIIDDEDIGISFYAEIDGDKYEVPHLEKKTDISGWGYVVDEKEVDDGLTDLGKTWDNKLYYLIESNSTNNYVRNPNNPYVLERDLGFTRFVSNQIGILEERPVKRIIDFSQIFKKESNLYDTRIELKSIPTSCVRGDANCTIFKNVTVKTKKVTDFSFTQDRGGNWIVMFENIYDLDPSFLDSTDTDWNNGGFVNMSVDGSGSDANLTSATNSEFGSFGSQIFDAGGEANWSNISISTPVPYGAELGGAFNDTNGSLSPFINTTGLVLYHRYNNDSDVGEIIEAAGDKVYDYSVDLNPERDIGSNNNGSVTGDARINLDDFRIGGGSVELDGSTDYVDVPDSNSVDLTRITITLWAQFDRNSGDHYMVEKAAAGVNPNYYFWIDDGAGFCGTDVLCGGFFNTVAAFRDHSFTWKPVVGQWVHLAMTYDGVRFKMYINGTQVSDVAETTTPFRQGASVKVGIQGTLATEMDGRLDEVTIWNRSLGDEEIFNLYLRGSTRLNLSYRTCDDAACDGESFIEVQNQSFMNSKITLNNSINNQYFQYNLTNFRNVSKRLTDKLIINNVTIEYFPTAVVVDNNLTVNFSLFLNNAEMDIISTFGETFTVHYLVNVSHNFNLTRNGSEIANNSIQNPAIGFYNYTITTNGTVANFSNLSRFAEVIAFVPPPVKPPSSTILIYGQSVVVI